MNKIWSPYLLPSFVGRRRALLPRVFAAFLAVSMLTTGLYHRPATARADGPCNITLLGVFIPCPPPTLLDYNLLKQSGSIYSATSQQQQSLQVIEQQAIADTITDHGLAASDSVAVQSWGRNTALAEMWALIVQAIQTSKASRTTDQQNAVDWLSSVDQREGVVSAQDAGLEYVKWAGLDQNAYQNLLATSYTQSDLQNFLAPTNFNPLPYDYVDSTGKSLLSAIGPGGVIDVGLAQNSTAGYCVYQAPSPYGSDYTSNVFNTGAGNTTPQTCFTPCASLLGCDPPTPSYDDFTKWGAADANTALFNSKGFVDVANAVAIAAGISGSAVAAGTGVGVATGLSSVLSGTAFQTAVFPFAARAEQTTITQAVQAAEAAGEDAAEAAEEVTAEAAEIGGETAAAGVGAAVGIAIFAIVTAVLEGITVVNAANLPDKLASLIVDAPSQSVDLGTVLSNSASGLFGLFIGAGLPKPTATSCDNSLIVVGVGNIQAPCLNAPAIPDASPTDLEFAIQAKGSTTTTTTSTLSWQDTSSGTTTTARLSETWFIDTVTATGLPATTTQTLVIRYTDWSGNDQIAWLTKKTSGGYTFIGVPTSGAGSAALDTANCLSTETCSDSSSIDFVGTDGNDYSASVVLPPLPTVSPTFSASPVEGSAVSFSANGFSPAGSPLTYQWQFAAPQPAGSACIPGPCVPPTTASGANVTNTWSSSGSFQVTLTATDAQNRSTVDTFTVLVGDVAPILALAPTCPANPSCDAHTVLPNSATSLHGTITHAGSADTESATINWGDGNSDSAQFGNSGTIIVNPDQNISLTASSNTAVALAATHSYAKPGAYSVTVTVTDQAGGKAGTTTTETVQDITTVTWPAPQPITYGTALGAAQLDAAAGATTAATVPGIFAYSVVGLGPVTPNEVLPAGSHQLSVQFTPNDTALYTTPTAQIVSLQVNSAPLTITASSPSSTYNGTVPAITPSYSSFVNNEGASSLSTQPTCTSNAPNSGTAGTYTTNCSGAVDSNYSFNYVPGLLTISKANTTAGLSTSGSPMMQGQSVTFTVVVAVKTPGAGTPTGTVTFYDGTTNLGSGSLSIVAGKAQTTFSSSKLAVGPHTISAIYAGDGNFLTSSSVALTQNVDTNLSSYPKLASGAYNLSNANLSGGYFAGLSLVGASLSGSNLTNANFSGASLTGANLSNSNFMGSTNFTDANLTNADMTNSNFKGANFTNANLTGANLSNSNLKGATVTNVVWSKTTCPDGTTSTNDGGTCVGHI